MFLRNLTLLLVLGSSIVNGYTYTAWTTMTGARTIAIAPAIYEGPIDDIGLSKLDLNTAFGIGDRFDAVVNLSNFSPVNSFTWGGIEIMPRYAVNDNIALALKIGTDFAALSLSPQLHLNKEYEKVVFELNAAIDLSTETDFKEGTIWASHGIVYKLVPDVFYPFFEFNPYIEYGLYPTNVSFSIDPGFWFGFKDTPHQIAISFPISGFKKDEEFSVGLNAWYWWSFEY